MTQCGAMQQEVEEVTQSAHHDSQVAAASTQTVHLTIAMLIAMASETRQTMPEERYLAQELIGKYLVALEPCQDGFQIKRQECPTSVTRPPLLSASPVSGFRDQQGKQRRCGSLGAMADESGAVQVHFGDVPLSEEVEEMKPPDVSDICTPPSDEERVTLPE